MTNDEQVERRISDAITGAIMDTPWVACGVDDAREVADRALAAMPTTVATPQLVETVKELEALPSGTSIQRGRYYEVSPRWHKLIPSKWRPAPKRVQVQIGAREVGRTVNEDDTVSVRYEFVAHPTSPQLYDSNNTTTQTTRRNLMDVPPCPECRSGKHTNCVGWALDARDQEVACPCEERGHA